MCVCVCVCVLVFIYRWGLKPEYTQPHGDLSRWGPKLRSSWVNKLINHTIKFFENLKMQNVSCEAKFRCRVGVG